MKSREKHNSYRQSHSGPLSLIGILRGLFVIIHISSCSTSRDIYNPGFPSPRHNVNHHASTANAQKTERPDWIYATSADFVVGQGEDTSIAGARNKALDNIKLIIGKAFPQSVAFSETSATGNRATSRHDVHSESAFIFVQHISNALDLELSLDFNNILDYYFEDRDNLYTYFVKYKICQSEIQRITKQLKDRKRKQENLIDSLVFIDTLLVVEDLLDRHHKIDLLLQSTANLPIRDSIRLCNTKQRMETILNQLKIRNIAKKGNMLLLEIHGFGRTFKTNIEPGIYHDGRVTIDNAYVENGLWAIKYSFNAHLDRKGFLDVEFNYPGFVLVYHTTLDNPSREIVKRGIEISNPRLEVLSKSSWSGNITKMQFVMNVKSESLEAPKVKDINLEIIPASGPSMFLSLKDHEFKSIFGENYRFSAHTDTCNIPVRFLRQVRHANIEIHVLIDGKPKTKNLTFEPISIQL